MVQLSHSYMIIGKAIALTRWTFVGKDHTVEVTNRFKGLDMIDRVPEELWTEVCDIVQEAVIKIIPKKNKCKRQNDFLRRSYK